ncbi:MAG TPA: hypothetical protein PKK10_14000 [Woeseiaceae bacterium]|nr:hypothetical protein [Woeseiaceae bacterium]
MQDSSIVLVLAVVGGYAFTLNYFPTHHRTIRSSGYALFYRSVFWGYVFFHAACLLLFILREADGLSGTFALFHDRSVWLDLPSIADVLIGPLRANLHDLITPSVLALWIGLIISLPLNAIVTEKMKAQISAKLSSQLELILTSSLVNAQMLLVTLDSGKVYAGWVIKTLDVAENNSDPGSGFRLLAYRSGYRSQDTQEVFFTTDYGWLFEEQQQLPVDNLATFIPLNRISAITNFDPELFDDFSVHSAKKFGKPPREAHLVRVAEPVSVEANATVFQAKVPQNWKERLRQLKYVRQQKP